MGGSLNSFDHFLALMAADFMLCGCISNTGHEHRQFWVITAEREDTGCFGVHGP